MATALIRSNSCIDVGNSEYPSFDASSYAVSYSYDETEDGQTNSPSLVIDEKRSNFFIDDEAREACDEEDEMEEDPVDEDYLEQVLESEKMATLMAQMGADETGAEAESGERLPEHYDEDFKDDWEVLDLRNIEEVDAAQVRLTASKGWIPPPEKNEMACYHLGGLDFVHIYEVPEADHGIKIEIRQWIYEDEDNSNDETRYGLRLSPHGLALTWDEFMKVLRHKKKVLYLMFRIIHDRFVDEKFPLGGNKFISVTHPFSVVSLRVWFQREAQGPFFPGRKGLSLKFQHFRRLLKLEDEMWYHSDIVQVRTHEKKKKEQEELAKLKETKTMKTTNAVRPKTLPKVKNQEAQKAREAAREKLKKQLENQFARPQLQIVSPADAPPKEEYKGPMLRKRRDNQRRDNQEPPCKRRKISQHDADGC